MVMRSGKQAQKRSSKKRSLQKKQTRRPAPQMRVTWDNLGPMCDFWGTEMKRFYNLETLASATERLIRGGDRFIVPSIKTVLGPSPLTSLTFELFQEGRYQLVFRVRASNVKRKRATFGFLVAKQEDKFSEIAQQELDNLRVLYKRAPDLVTRPFKGGTVYLPDRLKRKTKGREVYAYVTQWLGGFHELGINKNLQFFVNIKTPITMSKAITEALKGRMIEIVARSYDPKTRDCMEIPQVASGDFVVTKPGKGTPKLKLIACRQMVKKVSPARLIDNILRANWEWGQQTFYLAPEFPETLLDGLARAVGRNQAKDWISQYASAVQQRKYKERDWMPLEVIETLL